MDNFIYENERPHKYSTVIEDNNSLKDSARITKYLNKLEYIQAEIDIFKSIKPVRTVQDLIEKYSNRNHTISYNKNSHVISVRGSMLVVIFHAFIIDTRKFKFTDIILK